MYDVVVIECYYGSFGTGALHYVMDRRSEEEESCGAAGGIIKVPMKAMKLVVVWAWRKPIKRYVAMYLTDAQVSIDIMMR